MNNTNNLAENYLYDFASEPLKTLLVDRTTRKNIIWATDEYAHFGDGYGSSQQIRAQYISGIFGQIIMPRSKKTRAQQNMRIREKAEVFTPSWVCNCQNNLVDQAWFGKNGVFNTETEKGWQTNYDKVAFPDEKGKGWQDYVKENRLEITCGEAPYLASRYDTVTGAAIPVKDRIGLLDRKLRIVCENTDNESDWKLWAKKALQSVYGYDWQGDNVLLARENLLFTMDDYYRETFGKVPSVQFLSECARIISWNVWQMDGLKFVVPNSCHKETQTELTIFGEETTETACTGCRKNDPSKHNGTYCRIYDWSANRSVEFYSIYKGARK